MKFHKSFVTICLVLMVLISPILESGSQVLAELEGCTIGSPSSGNYSVEVCFTSPSNGSILSGDVNISTSFFTSGSFPGIQRMVFYLNNEYLLTDFEKEYTFILPTQKFADGLYVLSIVVVMRDGYVFQMGEIEVTFNNGNEIAPINTNSYEPFTSPPKQNGQPFMVAAGGDGASGITNSTNVTNLIKNLNPDMFLYLGDVYNKGTFTEFYNWYGGDNSFFGQFKSITNPVVGNHEYENGTAPGYFDYWDNVPDYYSYDSGGWHFIALNSNYSVVPVNPGSAQYQWLQSDLNSNSGKCTVVYFHHPLFNIGPPSSTTALMDIWNLLVQAGVEIVLTGHDHTYQRWSPLGINGQPDPSGVTQFVAGASGHGVQTIAKSDDRVAFYSDANPGALGVLMLGLNESGASFSYVNTVGEILDSGVIPCTSSNPDVLAPSIPGNVLANLVSSSEVEINWSNSTDDTGVAGYIIYRNGEEIANTPTGITTFLDSNILPDNTYSYSIEAFDLAGNHSGQSELVIITTPPLTGTLIFSVDSDTYVSSANLTSNYGRATTLRMDASPDLHSYLKFNVQGLAGSPISSARLKVFSNSNSNIGFQVKEVVDISWGEYSMNYNTAPNLGNLIASSGSINAGSWIEIDVTSYIVGEKLYSFGLDTTSSSAMSLASRESVDYAPILIIDLHDNNLDVVPPTTPAHFSAIENETGGINLSWSEASDNIGVSGYTIYRNDEVLAILSENTLSYVDESVSPGTSYNFSVDAFDQAGNHSDKSNVILVETIDNQPPSTPSGFSANAVSFSKVELMWNPSSDNVGIAGYTIYRDRNVLITLDSSQFGYEDSSVLPSSEYNYTLDAFDNAGNHSIISDPLLVTIPDLPQTLSLTPIADSYVDASKPTSNYGNSTTLRVDASPDLHAYIKFNIPNLGSQIVSNANLFVYANSTAKKGIQLFEVSDNSWMENNIVYSNAPQLDKLISSVSSVNAGEWAVFDVSSTINGQGDITFGINTTSSTSSNLASKENVTFSPYLVLDLITEIIDTNPPSTPTDLSASPINSNLVTLNWSESIDDVGITSYTIFRDGNIFDSISGSSTTYEDYSVFPNTEYSYAINAVDQSGNQSDISSSVFVTTPDIPDVITVFPVADSYVNASNPNINYGISSVLRADGTPDLHSFLQFNVNNLGQKTISKAQLFVYATSRTNKGLIVQSVSDNNWQESTITYQNAPPLGGIIGSASSGNTGVWLTIDISDLFIDEGLYSLGITTPSSTAISFASRESGSNSPYLLLDLSSNFPDTESPSRPSNLSVTLVNSSQIDLSWAASTDNIEVTGYTIYRDGTPIDTVSGFDLQYSDMNISPFSTYNYSVDAFDSEGNHSLLSDIVSISTPENEPPTTPEILSIEDNGPTHVTISWSPSSDNIGVVGYTVYRDGSILSVVDSDTVVLSDYSVYPGITYSYTMDAFDAVGNRSTLSSPFVVTVTSIDLEPPSVPLGLNATAVMSTQIDLIWNASSDNVDVVGYWLYRDGVNIASIPSSTLTFQDTSLSHNTTYTYEIEAYDQAGNQSGTSDPVMVTTLDLPTSLVFETVADSYVNESLPSTNFGNATSLRVDGSPILNSFLRFSVQGLFGKPITRVELLVFANSGSGNGLDVFEVTDNLWAENTINFLNAPLMGNVITNSTSTTASNWLVFDVSSYVINEGEYSFGISTPGSTSISLASRESGTSAPQLIIYFD